MCNLPILDYQEIGKHNTSSSAYVVYEGIVLDITEFLNKHPGGRPILNVSLGTDITNVLDSFHDVRVSKAIKNSFFQQKNGIKVIGRTNETLEGGRYSEGTHDYQARRLYSQNDPMWDSLRREVFDFIRKNDLPTKKPLAECIALLAIFYSTYLVVIYAGFIYGLPWLCLLLGPIATFMAVNVGHTVMHGGFSNNNIVNLLGRGLGDASGYSSGCWDVEHQIHHQAPHSEIDLQTAPPSGVKFFEHQETQWHHRYQTYYMWVLFTIYSPTSWVVHSIRTLFVYPSITPFEKLHHIFFKTTCFVIPIALSFYFNTFWVALGCFAAYSISMSYFSIFTLFIQHEDSYLPESSSESWAARQIKTSVSWKSNSKLFEWLFGYFNYHTEHHLFPGINPSLYPAIQPIVKRICAEHNVQYKHVSYMELVKSQYRAWQKYSNHMPAFT